MTETRPKIYAVVPAAGIGQRMGADRPKQYLALANQTLLECTLSRLLSASLFDHILVAIAEDDKHWQQLPPASHPLIRSVKGGSERADSVLAALQHISGEASEDTWVLVHDMARPCITAEQLQTLYRELAEDPVGGILALPVSDTVKRVSGDANQSAGSKIDETLDRSVLWLAQTPQMFRLGLLREALEQAREKGLAVTDEASALEHLGYAPRVVEGAASNLKVTRPEDLALAEFIWASQQQTVCRSTDL